ncbi:MAG: acetyl-CoA carboxylase biotin carboxyl carrier protein [Gemmatimonadota bacterium]
MDFDFVQQLIRAVDASSIDNIEVERGGTRIRISKTPSGTALHSGAMTAPPPVGHGAFAAAPKGSNPHAAVDPGGQPTSDDSTHVPDPVDDWEEVTSPMVGTFYRSPSPEADPFAEVGTRVSAGDTLCIIEAMKLMNGLEAELDGTIREICVEDGDPVEYGQVLFRMEPA